MKSTTVIELYAGPGAGKSTLAAGLFSEMKSRLLSVELVTEVAKEWAWSDRRICGLDESVLYGRQLERESRLYGKVDYVITDRPLKMSAIYAGFYGTFQDEEIFNALVARDTKLAGVDRVPFFVTREKPYNQEGRFEDEHKARALDLLVGTKHEYVSRLAGSTSHRINTILSWIL